MRDDGVRNVKTRQETLSRGPPSRAEDVVAAHCRTRRLKGQLLKKQDCRVERTG